MQLGFHPNMSDEVYHSLPGYSKTVLCEPTPYDYWAKRVYTGRKPEEKEKDSYIAGRLFHCMQGEPEELHKRFVKNQGLHSDGSDKPIRKNSKEYAQWFEKNPGKTLITPSMWEECERMVTMLGFNKVAQAIYSKPGYSECSFLSRCPATNVLTRCRPDRMDDQVSVVGDLKTTGDLKSSPNSFPWEALKYHYHVSAAYTQDIIRQTTGKVPKYLFIVIEKPWPHRSAVWEVTSKGIELGRQYYQNRIKLLELCKQTGYYPTYFKGEKKYEKPHELFTLVEEL